MKGDVRPLFRKSKLRGAQFIARKDGIRAVLLQSVPLSGALQLKVRCEDSPIKVKSFLVNAAGPLISRGALKFSRFPFDSKQSSSLRRCAKLQFSTKDNPKNEFSLVQLTQNVRVTLSDDSGTLATYLPSENTSLRPSNSHPIQLYVSGKPAGDIVVSRVHDSNAKVITSTTSTVRKMLCKQQGQDCFSSSNSLYQSLSSASGSFFSVDFRLILPKEQSQCLTADPDAMLKSKTPRSGNCEMKSSTPPLRFDFTLVTESTPNPTLNPSLPSPAPAPPREPAPTAVPPPAPPTAPTPTPTKTVIPTITSTIIPTVQPTATPQPCRDGVDNDADGLVDYPADPGCRNSGDDTEVRDDFEIASCDRVQKDGFTFGFTRSYRCGQYLNGDWWVQAPIGQTVGISWISPDYVTGSGWNGYQVLPSQANALPRVQSLMPLSDARAFTYVTPSPFPLSVRAGDRVLKILSGHYADPAHGPNGAQRDGIRRAVVLTIVSTIPNDGGASEFRPGYYNGSLTPDRLGKLRANILPLIARPANSPELSGYLDQIKLLQLDHLGLDGIGIRPLDATSTYGDFQNQRWIEMLLLMLSETDPVKRREVIIHFIQAGIDTISVLDNQNGWVQFEPVGGWGWGRWLPSAFAATLLDSTRMRNTIQNLNPTNLAESDVYRSAVNGKTLWGDAAAYCVEGNRAKDMVRYWSNIAGMTLTWPNTNYPSINYLWCRDPYQMVDGGSYPGELYHSQTAAKIVGMSLLIHLVPQLKTIRLGQELYDYGIQYYNVGTTLKPDTCAPPRGVCVGGSTPGQMCTRASEGFATTMRCKGEITTAQMIPARCYSLYRGKYCVGGTNNGAECTFDSECPGLIQSGQAPSRESSEIANYSSFCHYDASQYGHTWGDTGLNDVAGRPVCVPDTDPSDGIGRFAAGTGYTPNGWKEWDSSWPLVRDIWNVVGPR